MMFRFAVRPMLVAALLLITTVACNTGDDSGSSRGQLRDGYGSSIDSLPPEPEAPTVDVATVETATVLSRLAADCPSLEVIDHAKKGDLGAFADCLRAGNDPWIIEAATGKRVRAWDEPGKSALYLAAAGGHHDIVVLLVDRYDVDPNWGGALQNVPLVKAIDEGHFDIATFLLERGADTRRWTPYRDNAISAALMKKDPKYLRAVLETGAYPNDLVTDESLGPMFIALNTRRYAHAKLLAEHGACIPRDTRQLERNLERARRDRDREPIQQLLDTFEARYDPTCQMPVSLEGDYRWEVARTADEVEIAEPAS
ncbi:MAG: ankyrin repeat domain-containing protein [Acidobacteriota bacterium]